MGRTGARLATPGVRFRSLSPNSLGLTSGPPQTIVGPGVRRLGPWPDERGQRPTRSGVVSGFPSNTAARRTRGSDPDMGEPMPKNKGGREIRKPKQPKKPKPVPSAPMRLRIDGAAKNAK